MKKKTIICNKYKYTSCVIQSPIDDLSLTNLSHTSTHAHTHARTTQNTNTNTHTDHHCSRCRFRRRRLGSIPGRLLSLPSGLRHLRRCCSRLHSNLRLAGDCCRPSRWIPIQRCLPAQEVSASLNAPTLLRREAKWFGIRNALIRA